MATQGSRGCSRAEGRTQPEPRELGDVSDQLENPAFRAVFGTSFLAFCMHPAWEVVALGRNECAGDHGGINVSGL